MTDQYAMPTEDSIPEASRSGTQAPASALDVFKIRNFRLLWIGETISLLGDQFYLIALPWLVLQLTRDPLVMSTVLAVAGIPRAIFMLVGGAMTDRFSPRTLMLGSNGLRMVLTALMALLVGTGQIQLWMLYGFALIFGLVDAFFFPAQAAIVPQVVDGSHLQGANALVQGTARLSLFVGPVIAGAMIAALDGGPRPPDTAPSTRGLALAFAFDAATFFVSALTLWMMTLKPKESMEANGEGSSNVLRSIREGFLYVWNDVTLRNFFLLVAAVDFLISGPFSVGVPVMADSRLPEKAAAYGILLSAYGGGSLVGILLAGVLPKPSAKRMGALLLFVTSLMGFGMAALGFMHSTVIAAVVSLVMGIANGYVVILFMTWLQSRTPEQMLGRMMSLLMFSSVGLLPVSMALSGAIVKWSLAGLLGGAGLLMAVITLLAALNPATRKMGEEIHEMSEAEAVG